MFLYVIRYDIIYDIMFPLTRNDWVLALHCRFILSMRPSVKPRRDQNSMAWLRLSTQVMTSSRSFWLHCGGICSSVGLVSPLWDWRNSMPCQWSCLNCSRTTCHTERVGQRAGILKKHTVFFTRCVTFCCLVGLRTSVTRALSMATLITARNWPIARTTRRYISRYFGHIPARVTCSTSGRWKQIWLTLRKTKVKLLRSLWQHLLLIRRVKLVRVSWGSDTRRCNQYTLGN